jgi:hypothetical protein
VAVVLCRTVQRHFKSKEVCLAAAPRSIASSVHFRCLVELSIVQLTIHHPQVYLHTNCIAVLFNVCSASRCRVLHVPHPSLTGSCRNIDPYAAQRIMNMSAAARASCLVNRRRF